MFREKYATTSILQTDLYVETHDWSYLPLYNRKLFGYAMKVIDR